MLPNPFTGAGRVGNALKEPSSGVFYCHCVEISPVQKDVKDCALSGSAYPRQTNRTLSALVVIRLNRSTDPVVLDHIIVYTQSAAHRRGVLHNVNESVSGSRSFEPVDTVT